MSPAPAKMVDFEAASLAVKLAQFEGNIKLLDSQVSQSIQNLTGTMQAMQADIQSMSTRSADNNTLLTAMAERSHAVERIALAVEESGKGHAGDTRNVSLEMAQMRGFIRGVMLCGALGFGTLAAFVIYRLDRTDEAIEQLRESVRHYLPIGAVPP